ncbi:hypothetical protein OUZ56_019070 [Daphnia magna]|uniref:Zinc finger protein n=1 Tax=Daphnia magna TaxID=35525 RepID=A0ABQ9ZAK5_9CRUS|nr:hypothetical protein OUZ56_019070 [Daphnia magna]
MKKRVCSFIKVHGNGHAKCVAQSITDSWEKECYANVKIFAKHNEPCNLGSKFLSANKCVLAAASQKLAWMLADTEEDVTIIVAEHDFSTLKLLLQYIYTGEVLIDNNAQELQTLIAEWEIGHPDVISISAIESRSSNFLSTQQSKNSPHQRESRWGSTTSPNDNIITGEKATSACSYNSKDVIHLCLTPEKESLQQNITESIDRIEHHKISIGIGIPVIDIPRDAPTVGHSNLLVGNLPAKKGIPKTKPVLSAKRSKPNQYVFLSTYIKKSKNKLHERAVNSVTSKGTLWKAGKSNAQMVETDCAGKSVTTSNQTKEFGEGNAAADGIQTIELMKSTFGCKDPSACLNNHYTSEVAEAVDTEEDLKDLTLATKLLGEEKANHQKLTGVMLDLSKMVKRHKIYAKHFLGPVSIDSKSAGYIASRIPCVTCGKIVFRDYMSTHVKIHTTERPFLCDQCGQTFALPERLRNHLKNMHPDESQLRLHICSECGKSFKKAEYLKRHLTFHNGLKPYSCPYCDKSFRLPNVLLKHKRTHTGEKPYECETCHRRFSARTSYVVHLQTHRKKSRVLETTETESFVDPETQLLKCDVCNTTFHREYAFLVHKAAHKGEVPKLPCRHCSETFGSYKLLREHTRDHHADALYQCEQCPSMFANKTALHSHLQIHLQGKQFSCDRCGKEFQTKVQLQTHNRSVHSDLRPFSCRFCDKTFKSKLTLRQHERIHTGERPYQCPHCSKAFRQDVHLVNHIRLHTGEKPFVCTYCNKAFAHKNNLSIHVKIHTGAKNMCSVCGQVFRSIVKLRLHEGIHTPLSVPTTEGDIAEETL